MKLLVILSLIKLYARKNIFPSREIFYSRKYSFYNKVPKVDKSVVYDAIENKKI